MAKPVYELSVDMPRSPVYFITKKSLAEKLKKKLDEAYGADYKITLKKTLPEKNYDSP